MVLMRPKLLRPIDSDGVDEMPAMPLVGRRDATQPLERDMFQSHCTAVDSLQAAGIAAPLEWHAIRARFRDFVTTPDNAADILAAEVIKPSGRPITEARADALIERLAGTQHHHDVVAYVQAKVLEAMRHAYLECSDRNYRLASRRYETITGTWRLIAGQGVDLDNNDANILNSANRQQRDSWHDAVGVTGELEASMRLVLAAASLCEGLPDNLHYVQPPGAVSPGPDIAVEELQLGVVLGLTDQHKRHHVWRAWRSGGNRCGRWWQLAQANVMPYSASIPTRAQPYRWPDALVPMFDTHNRITQWDVCCAGPAPEGWKP